MYSVSWSHTTHSISFDTKQRLETNLQFLKINGKSAFLRNGLSSACLRSDLNVAEVRDVLIMSLHKGDIDYDIAFTMLVAIGSS